MQSMWKTKRAAWIDELSTRYQEIEIYFDTKMKTHHKVQLATYGKAAVTTVANSAPTLKPSIQLELIK